MSAVLAQPEPVVIGRILLNADEFVAAMVAKRIPGHVGFESYRALGVMRQGVLIGGVVYHNYRGHDCEVTAALEPGRWASRRVLRALFSFPFLQLGCSRLTAITSAENGPARKSLADQGFEQEGVHPRAWHDGISDAISYGMLKEACRWIKD